MYPGAGKPAGLGTPRARPHQRNARLPRSARGVLPRGSAAARPPPARIGQDSEEAAPRVRKERRVARGGRSRKDCGRDAERKGRELTSHFHSGCRGSAIDHRRGELVCACEAQLRRKLGPGFPDRPPSFRHPFFFHSARSRCLRSSVPVSSIKVGGRGSAFEGRFGVLRPFLVASFCDSNLLCGQGIAAGTPRWAHRVLARVRIPWLGLSRRLLADPGVSTAMKIAITGGTGFVGRHLARRLIVRGHEVVLIARGVYRRDPGVRELDGSKFFPIGTGNEDRLAEAFTGCSAIAHCAGINRELGKQTYADVHVQGTRNVVNAAKRAGVSNILLLSFLRARPHCGSAYHESKWQAEEIVRSSGLEYTVLKPGVIYGRGDHLLDHLSHALHTFPAFAAIGLRGTRLRPLAVDDLTRIMEGVLSDGRLSYQTVAVTGPEELRLSEVVRRVGKVI